MLAALCNDVRIYAHAAQKGAIYLCPGCKAELVLRKGAIKIHHFAHKPPVECQFGAGESREHLEAKLAIYQAFVGRSLRAEMEWPLEALTGDRRADVFVWDMSGAKIAFELQHTDISQDLLERRTSAYLHAGIAVLWLPFLKPRYREFAQKVAEAEEGDWVIPDYKPRPFEFWLSAFGFGTVWYWAQRSNRLMRGKIEPVKEKVENPFWGGPEEHRVGYRLRLWGPYDPAALSIRIGRRNPWENGRYTLPGGPTASLMAPGTR
ncbi:MAG: competence protein CoiA [Aestuariivirga sp.]